VDFLRVDFYAIGERIVVGELTNYPWAGSYQFADPSYDREFGSYWQQGY